MGKGERKKRRNALQSYPYRIAGAGLPERNYSFSNASSLCAYWLREGSCQSNDDGDAMGITVDAASAAVAGVDAYFSGPATEKKKRGMKFIVHVRLVMM